MMVMLMLVFVFMCMSRMGVLVFMRAMIMVFMCMSCMFMLMLVFMLPLQMHIKLHSLDVRPLFPSGMQVKAIQLQFEQFAIQLLELNTKIEHRANEHVATNAAENIEVNSLHFSSPAASALI